MTESPPMSPRDSTLSDPTPLDSIRLDVPRFPADFAWGVATAAYQVEGGVAEGGRLDAVAAR